MSLRVAIGGFQHESHSFAPVPTRWEEFLNPAGYPALTGGPAMLAAIRDTSVPAAGALAAAEAAGAVVAPLIWCAASPAGPVTDDAFERIAARLCAALSTALDEGPLGAVYLDLHGAALTPSIADPEGEILTRIRRIVGPDIALTASLDPHANLTARMVAAADALVPYRSYPHVDMRAAGARALALALARRQRGAPWAKAFRQLDFLIPITSQCTLAEPMHAAMAERARLAEAAGIAELAFCFGFPYADFADCGPAIAAFAATATAAESAAEALAGFLAAREAAFALDILPAEAAVAETVRLARARLRPVVIADAQDNPGGGGHGDTTGLLAALLEAGAEGAVLCLINDAESAAACHAAGEGAPVTLALGGKSDGAPLPVSATVLRLTDGRFTLTGKMGAGNPVALGPTALIEVAGAQGGGVRVMLASRKIQALDLAILRHVGIEPAECPILALKSSVHFRADFGPIAARVIVAAAPGPVIADPSTLPFGNLRPGLRRRPGG